jgi:hypothetical protein
MTELPSGATESTVICVRSRSPMETTRAAASSAASPPSVANSTCIFLNPRIDDCLMCSASSWTAATTLKAQLGAAGRHVARLKRPSEQAEQEDRGSGRKEHDLEGVRQ